MRFLPLLLTLAMTLGLSACSEAEPSVSTSQPSQGVVSNQQEADGSNILIAYFSVPENVSTDGVDAVSGASIVVDNDEVLGSTEYVAQVIQQTIGGDLFRIEAAEPYPLDHELLVDQASEERDNQVRPELTSHVDHFEQYEVILLGYPIWWGDMPMPVYSFLEEYDFGAKVIIPFITHGGSGAAGTIDTISQLQPGALIRDNALVLSRGDVAGSIGTVSDWVLGLDLVSDSGLPGTGDGNTVLTATVASHSQQVFYLWEEGNVPAVTEYTVNNGNYSDDPDFRPYVTSFPVPDGTEIKGAVLICAGGAFQYRSDQFEGTPVAEALSQLGYRYRRFSRLAWMSWASQKRRMSAPVT